MKKLNVALLYATLLLGGSCFSQDSPHSGILHTTATGEESNLIKLHCEALDDPSNESVIRLEFQKYKSQIKSVDIDVINQKIYIKYANTIDANMLLGILERVNLDAYYLDANNTAVIYTKAGNENFIR